MSTASDGLRPTNAEAKPGPAPESRFEAGSTAVYSIPAPPGIFRGESREIRPSAINRRIADKANRPIRAYLMAMEP